MCVSVCVSLIQSKAVSVPTVLIEAFIFPFCFTSVTAEYRKPGPLISKCDSVAFNWQSETTSRSKFLVSEPVMRLNWFFVFGSDCLRVRLCGMMVSLFSVIGRCNVG